MPPAVIDDIAPDLQHPAPTHEELVDQTSRELIERSRRRMTSGVPVPRAHRSEIVATIIAADVNSTSGKAQLGPTNFPRRMPSRTRA